MKGWRISTFLCALVALVAVALSVLPKDAFNPPKLAEEPEIKEPEINILFGVAPEAEFFRRLMDIGIETIVILQETDSGTCLFWVRWRDGRELCVPPKPPEAPPIGTLFFEDRGVGRRLYVWDGNRKVPLSGNKTKEPRSRAEEVMLPCPDR